MCASISCDHHFQSIAKIWTASKERLLSYACCFAYMTLRHPCHKHFCGFCQNIHKHATASWEWKWAFLMTYQPNFACISQLQIPMITVHVLHLGLNSSSRCLKKFAFHFLVFCFTMKLLTIYFFVHFVNDLNSNFTNSCCSGIYCFAFPMWKKKCWNILKYVLTVMITRSKLDLSPWTILSALTMFFF